jgi:PAS domain S-box-containing protein
MFEQDAALLFQREFCRRTGLDFQLAGLFEHLPMVAFFAKDEESRFVRANPRLRAILGRTEEWEVLGKSDVDFRTPAIAAAYHEEDRQVMRSGRGLARITQMVPDVGGQVNWYLTTKQPLRDAHGKICGIIGAMYETKEVGGTLQPFTRIEPALRHLHLHYADSISTAELARLTHLSERQFLRIFREAIGESPMRHLVRQRIHMACQALIATDQAAGTIAQHCGFYDQSAFIRAFRDFTGITPSAYRKRHVGGNTPGTAQAG